MKKISVVSLIIIIIDRIIKILVESFLPFEIRNVVINNFFYLTFCKNEGAAFSILNGSTIFLILFAVIAIYLLYRFIKSEKDITKYDILCYGLLLGGIIGNFIDRFIYGYVIDYLDFNIFNFNFAIFNFADMAIVVGAVLMIFSKGSDKDGRDNNKGRN